MKASTFLLIGLVLVLLGLLLPKALDPASSAISWIRLLRVPGMICLIIGLIRLFRENRQRKPQ